MGSRNVEYVGMERADNMIFMSLSSLRFYEANRFDSSDNKFYLCADLNNCQKAVKYHVEVRRV